MSGAVNDVPSTSPCRSGRGRPGLERDARHVVRWQRTRRTPTRRPSRRSSRSPPWVRFASATTTGCRRRRRWCRGRPPRAPTRTPPGTSRGSCSRCPAEATMKNPSGWIGSNRSVTSTTALRPTGSSWTPGDVGIEVARHGAERVDDHRRPVPPRDMLRSESAIRRAADTSVARPERSETRASCTIAPGTSVAITPAIASRVPVAGESASRSPLMSISSLSAERERGHVGQHAGRTWREARRRTPSS